LLVAVEEHVTPLLVLLVLVVEVQVLDHLI